MSELIASERGCWGEMSPIVNCLVQGGEGLERRETATAYSSHRHSNNPIRSTPKKRAQLVQKFVVALRKSPRCSKFFSPASRQKDLTHLYLDTAWEFSTVWKVVYYHRMLIINASSIFVSNFLKSPRYSFFLFLVQIMGRIALKLVDYWSRCESTSFMLYGLIAFGRHHFGKSQKNPDPRNFGIFGIFRGIKISISNARDRQRDLEKMPSRSQLCLLVL